MFEGLDNFQKIFWACAILGTTFFVMKALLSVIGGFHHDLDGHMGDAHEVSHDGIDSSDAAFKFVSLTSLTGFFMMFGWVGLAAYDGNNNLPALLFAFLAGLGTMLVTALIFKAAGKIAGGGARFEIKNTVGQKASVYQRIPGKGRGRIQIVIADATRELDAQSEDHVDIESHTSVEIVRVIDNETVSVKSC